MAIFRQRQVVEVNFKLPGGAFKAHPVIILSNKEAIDAEGAFIGVMISSNPDLDEFSFEISSKMLSKPLKKDCQVRCHLVAFIDTKEVTIPNISELKKTYFDLLLTHIFENVFTES